MFYTFYKKLQDFRSDIQKTDQAPLQEKGEKVFWFLDFFNFFQKAHFIRVSAEVIFRFKLSFRRLYERAICLRRRNFRRAGFLKIGQVGRKVTYC